MPQSGSTYRRQPASPPGSAPSGSGVAPAPSNSAAPVGERPGGTSAEPHPLETASFAHGPLSAGVTPVLPAASDMPIDAQPTIITKSPEIARYPITGLHPRDVGQFLAGKRLGHFELMQYVGGGGMGAVFRALDLMLNRVVAVKVLSQDQSGDEETLRRFKNEAQSAARLDHENISRVYYVGEDGGWHYIVFEFIDGANLRELVERQGPLPLETALGYTLQIADALTHASRRDVVHRDIKPSNVIVTFDQRAKLVDMGLARLHQVEPAGNDLTASGVTLGTFDYISPEQARDPRAADVRSDIYSLGCTLYFMLTGRPPFPGGTVLQKLLQHQGDDPPDPREFRPDLPEEFTRLLHRMLAKSPDKRFQRPDELIAEMLSFAGRYGLSTSLASSLTWQGAAESPLPRFARHLPWAVPVAVLAVVVGVLNVLGVRAREEAIPPRPRSNAASGFRPPPPVGPSASPLSESEDNPEFEPSDTEPTSGRPNSGAAERRVPRETAPRSPAAPFAPARDAAPDDSPPFLNWLENFRSFWEDNRESIWPGESRAPPGDPPKIPFRPTRQPSPNEPRGANSSDRERPDAWREEQFPRPMTAEPLPAQPSPAAVHGLSPQFVN